MRPLAALILTAAFILLLAAFPAFADPLVAAVRVNGAPAGTVEFKRDGDRLKTDAQTLQALRLRPPAFETDVEMGDLPGVRYRIDERAQLVDITADLQAITPTHLAAGRPRIPPPERAPWGAALNYAVFVQKAGPADVQASALAEVRVFGPYGVLTQSASVRHGSAGMAGGLQRLETTYTLEDYRHARRLLLGDYVSAGAAWSAPVRAAGVRLTSDLTLRPDLVAQPLVQVRGAAATASAVDLYVDGVQRLRADAPPGPFSVEAAPMMDGRGRIDVVVVDALGRRTVQTLPFYASGDLLAPGRLDYSLEAGRLREGFASDHDRYTDAFAAVSLRRGMSSHVTLEGRASAREDLQTGGVAMTAKLGEEALVTVALSGSRGPEGSGSQIYAAARRETRSYSLYAVAQRSDRSYRDLADLDDRWRVRGSLQLGAAWRSDRWGALAVSHTRLERPDREYGLTGVSWSKGYDRFSLFASLLSDDRGGGSRLTLGLTAPLGAGRSATAGVVASRGGARVSAGAAAAPTEPSGWGWRLFGETGSGAASGSRLEAEVRRVSTVGEVGAAVATYDGQGAAQAYAMGSVAWIGGGRPVAAARLGDAFGMIDTGRPGVEVLIENRPAGVTGPDGRLFAPQLSPLAASRVAIRAESVALDEDLAVQSLLVRPPRGAGIVVRMPVQRSRSVLVKLTDPDGAPLAVGARVTVDGAPSGLVGFDGLAYLAGLTSRSLVEITGEAGQCRLEIPHDTPAPPGVPIGPFACRPVPDGRLAPGRVADSGEGGELHR